MNAEGWSKEVVYNPQACCHDNWFMHRIAEMYTLLWRFVHVFPVGTEHAGAHISSCIDQSPWCQAHAKTEVMGVKNSLVMLLGTFTFVCTAHSTICLHAPSVAQDMCWCAD